jgi:hypothetical protein
MPMMSWQPYPGAGQYKLHLVSNGFETILASQLPYAAYTSTAAPVTPGDYSWYVEADDGTGALLAHGPSATFTIVSPDVIGSGDYLTPTRCQLPTSCTPVTDTPTMSWNPAPEAGVYIVTIANDPNFTNIVQQYTTAFTSLTPRASLRDNQAGQAYYWFVRSCVDLSHCGPGPDSGAKSNASAFQKQSLAIAPMSPLDQAIVPNQMTFTWHDYLDTYGADAPINQEARQ